MPSAPLHHEILPNGLTLLLRESHLAPVVEFQIWARVGSADERRGEAGLAHFHEHMLFKGTESRGVGDLAGAVEGVGGRVNAFTSYDVTVYHATTPRDGFPLAREVISDMVRNAVFDPEELSREIEVVLEEIKRAEDSPGQVCSEALFAECYRVHPYRAPILGTRDSVSRFDPTRVRDFYRRWYAPDNLAIVAVGDFDAAVLADTLRAEWAAAEPAHTRRHRPQEPAQHELRSTLLRRPFERACLDLSWPAVNLSHADTPYLDLLAFVLGEGDSSRLVRRVKERDGLVDRADAYCYTPLDPGGFGVSADLDAQRVAPAVESLVHEVTWLRREAVAEAELEKARANFLASEHFERESVSGQARKLGSFHALAGDHGREAVYLEAIRTASAEDLLRVARTYLDPQRLTVAAVLPEGQAADLDEKAVARAVSQGAERAERAGSRPRRRADAVPTIHSYELPGGAALHVERRPEVPVVAVRAAFLGGQLVEDEASAGISHFLTSMWLRGTRGRSDAELARAIESIASDLDGYSGRNSFGLSLEVASASLARALELFAEVLLEPAFAPEQIERERRDTLAALARREDRLGARVFDLFAETHWRRHPYRLPLLGAEGSVTALTREDLQTYQSRWVRAGNLCLAVSGDVDPDSLAETLSLRLADLPDDEFVWTPPPEEPVPGEPREAELRKERAQAHLVIGFRGLTVRDPDRFALEVIAQILAGQGGRLFLELRDRQGLAYSVNAVNVEGLSPGLFAVSIASSPDKLEAAERGIVDQLRRLLDRAPDAGELARARNYLIGNFEIDRQRNASRAAHVALDSRYGLGPEEAENYAGRMAAVSAEDVLRVARRVIDLNGSTRARIRP